MSGVLADGDGVAAGGGGETAATIGGVAVATGGATEGAGGFTVATGDGNGVGEICATMIGGVRVLAGEGVGDGFWFFLFPLVDFDGGGEGGGAGGGVTTATFGASTWPAGSTRINSFVAGGGGVEAIPATDSFVFGEFRSR